MAAMVVIPVIGSIGSELGRLPVARVVALLTAAILYVAWNLHGTSAAVRVLLWDGASPVPDTAKLPVLGALRYFALQLGLAALVYSLGDRGRVPNLIWLTLLPPVAYSVILLGRSGTAFVSVTTLLILTERGLLARLERGALRPACFLVCHAFHVGLYVPGGERRDSTE